jgi:formate hydrogenlyase subunit 6/NADH:ubiquinone oxidoreductase subunit I
MILYQIYHGGAWEWIFTHALTEGKGKESILLVANDNEKTFGSVDGLDAFVSVGIFSRVVYYRGYIGVKQKSIESMEKVILAHYEDFFSHHDIDLSSLEAIYTTSDMIHSFGVYLAIKKIPYYFYETFVNHFTTRLPMKGRNLYENLLEKYGAYNANNDLVTPILFGESYNPFPADKQILRFDVQNEIQKLSEKTIKQLYKLCGLGQINVEHSKDICLVIASSMWNAGIAVKNNPLLSQYVGGNTERLYNVYQQMAIDYFAPEGSKIVYKYHPYENIKDLEAMLPGAIPIDRKVGIHLFDRFTAEQGVSFVRTLSFGSTAAKKTDISSIIDLYHLIASVHLLNGYYACFSAIRDIFRSSISVRIFEKTEKPSSQAKCCSMMGETLFGIMPKRIKPGDRLDPASVIIVTDQNIALDDSFLSKTLINGSTVAFFDVDAKHIPQVLNKPGMNYYCIKGIIEKSCASTSLLSSESEFIYIYTRDSSIRDKFTAYHIQRELKYSKTNYSAIFEDITKPTQSKNNTKERCTGCGACANLCPQKAISMKADLEGFLSPVIDKSCCTNCGLCVQVCPCNRLFLTNDVLNVYAFASNDSVRSNSSSGGLFNLAAEWIISHGGVVCGAEYSADFKSVSHIVIERTVDLLPLQKSKYVQSDTGLTFRGIRDALQAGRYALFCGTPCQIAGLRNYCAVTKINADKLFALDVICHGTPSQLVWQTFLAETTEKARSEIASKLLGRAIISSAIVNADMRSKYKGWMTNLELELELELDDGTKINHIIRGEKHRNFSWWYVFLRLNVIQRESCYNCAYANLKRQGDLTIGDFWGVDKYIDGINDKKGLTLVLANNVHGEWLLREVCLGSKKPIVNYRLPDNIVSQLARMQKGLNGGWLRPEGRGEWFDKMNSMGFYHAYEYFYNLNNNATLSAKKEFRFDIGIVGWYYSGNLGDVLTNWALNYFLRSLGQRVLFIQDPYVPESKYSFFQKQNAEFVKKYYNISSYRTLDQLGEMNGICDKFLVSGGQIWRWQWFKKRRGFYDLGFAADNHIRTSITPSLGVDTYDLPPEEYDSDTFINCRANIQKFNKIFVREENGVKILNSTFGVTAQQILDPIFFVGKAAYETVANVSKKNVTGDYLFAYFLNPSKATAKSVKDTAKLLGVELIYFVPPRNEKQDVHNKKMAIVTDSGISPVDGGLQDWIKLISNCKYVVTDSFHCSCLSVIFQKPFVCVSPKQETNGRFNFLYDIKLETNLLTQEEINNSESIAKKLTLLIDWTNIVSQISERVERDIVHVKKILNIERKEEFQ